jgi:Bardet-Biedl syndrome 7 protein
VLDKAKVKYLVNIEGIPTSLNLMFGDGGEKGNDILFGTSDGRFGLLTIAG